ncbi:sigma-70 family RNA polymerase sigma factor [Mucilaginibacter sp. CSA2-8R]|uniref:RNA polymerase sigma factor n=1 Tax=Mucilaginibacter sp. CSA2-8R TaxID=3141542 RepID=UPI00315D9415
MKEAFVNLITQHQGLIFKVCNMYCRQGEDKEDLFQDILLQLWRAYPSFNNGAKITTWMYRVALNTAISRLRKHKTNQPTERLNDEAFKIEMVNDEESVARSTLMYAAIKQLTDIERAITMLYMDNYSYREIAEITGITESNVGYKINQIKLKLKNLVNPK